MTHLRTCDMISQLTRTRNSYAGKEGDVSSSGEKLHQILIEEREVEGRDRLAGRAHQKDHSPSVEGTHRQRTGEETDGI